MKLGRGDVELGQQLSLKTSKRMPKLHFLEQSSVDEAEQLVVVTLIVRADWFTREAGQHDHFAIMLLVKGKVGLIFFPQSVHAQLSVYRGGLFEQSWGGPRVELLIVLRRKGGSSDEWWSRLGRVGMRRNRPLSLCRGSTRGS